MGRCSRQTPISGALITESPENPASQGFFSPEKGQFESCATLNLPVLKAPPTHSKAPTLKPEIQSRQRIWRMIKITVRSGILFE
jgi:hypothetical protein